LVNLPEFKQARDHQLLLKTVAQHRPDLLGLLTDINAGQNDGIVLDTMHFKKGQAVTIMGRAGNMEQMWKFQENLLGQKGIKDVKITNNSRDAKSKKIKFTMEFQYKRFTKKDAVL
jgi:metal-responsive CopG/Arc/MetJ family transcriptional regulator